MKASLFFIALVGVAALASGLKVRQEFFSYTSTELMAPLDDVIKEIKAEEVDDLNNIAHAKTSQKMMEGLAAKAKTSMEAAMKQAATDLAAWKKTQADLAIREKEYATNDEVRAAEEGKVSLIKKQFQKLAAIGPADGTIGKMPASKLAAVKAALEELIQMNPRTESKDALNMLQRSSSKITDGNNILASLDSSIKTERKKDTDAVDAQKKIVKAANLVYEKAEAESVAKKNLKDQADARVVTAKAVVANEQKEYAKAQKIRDSDLATIEKAKVLIRELIATEAKHVAGGEEMELLQLHRKSAAITKIRTMIKAMKQDVDEEEAMQKMILDERKAAYDQAKSWRIANVSAWKAQVIEFEKSEKTWRKAYGEYHGAEMALSQETAIAEQERATINSVREMLKKLQSAEADTLGNCPLDKIGAVCSGQGDCKTNSTDPKRGKYCQCKSGSGRTGWDCSLCKFGWKMATGDLKGFCQQVYVPTVTFLQTSSQQYTVADLNNAVQNLMQTGRHAESSSAIEDLLTALEKTLADKEKMMRTERDDLKIKNDKAEAVTHAAKKLMKELEVKKDKAIANEEEEKAIYQMIYDMYWFEHPMRVKEKELLTKLDNLMIKMEGGEVFTSTPTATPTKFVGTNTHTPTTTPTVAAKKV